MERPNLAFLALALLVLALAVVDIAKSIVIQVEVSKLNSRLEKLEEAQNRSIPQQPGAPGPISVEERKNETLGMGLNVTDTGAQLNSRLDKLEEAQKYRSANQEALAGENKALAHCVNVANSRALLVQVAQLETCSSDEQIRFTTKFEPKGPPGQRGDKGSGGVNRREW